MNSCCFRFATRSPNTNALSLPNECGVAGWPRSAPGYCCLAAVRPTVISVIPIDRVIPAELRWNRCSGCGGGNLCWISGTRRHLAKGDTHFTCAPNLVTYWQSYLAPCHRPGNSQQPCLHWPVFAGRMQYRVPSIRRSAMLPMGCSHPSGSLLPPEQWIPVATVPAIVTQAQFDRSAEE